VQQTAEYPMAKRNDVPVKMDAEVVRVCKIVAAYRGLTLAEYLSETMREASQRDLAEETAKELGRGSKPQAKRGKAKE
jgi:hypothetical protein